MNQFFHTGKGYIWTARSILYAYSSDFKEWFTPFIWIHKFNLLNSVHLSIISSESIKCVLFKVRIHLTVTCLKCVCIQHLIKCFQNQKYMGAFWTVCVYLYFKGNVLNLSQLSLFNDIGNGRKYLKADELGDLSKIPAFCHMQEPKSSSPGVHSSACVSNQARMPLFVT